MLDFCRTTLFKAIKRRDGKLVCIDVDHLSATTKVVASEREYEIAIGQGWAVSPQEAMTRLEEHEDWIATQAAYSASDDKSMSPAAQAEVSHLESHTLNHVLEIPEAPRKRGRFTKKIVS